MCAVTGALTASGSASQYAWLEAIARVLTVAVPIAVGLFALHRPPFERFGALLVAAGAVWFLTTLANAENPTVYSIGRISQWVFEPMLFYLLLAFPSGRLGNRLDRTLVWIAVLLVLILYLPTVLLVEHYPVPAAVTSCNAGCPRNAFMVSGSEPAVIEDVVRPLRELITIVLFAVVAVRLAQRLRSATRLMRRALGPVLAVACFRCAVFAGALLGRRLAPGSDVIEVSVWLLAVAVPLTAVAFLAGLVRWWVFIAGSTQRLAGRLRGHATPEDLRAALAEAFDDPSLAIVYWLGNGEEHWGDAHGHPVEPPSAAPGRAVTNVVDGDRLVAAIVHDAALEDDRAFIDIATSFALMTLANHRLSARTSSLLRTVRASRARIQAAADDERRRIERDLHDGAQQQLVALRIKLELAAEEIGDGNGNGPARAAVLRRLGDDVEAALEEVRSLARGIYPAPLADHGLVEGFARRGAAQPASHHGPRGRRPAPLARDRERRLLLLPRGAPERRQARPGRQRRRDRAVGQRLVAGRGARRRRRLRPAGGHGWRRVHQHAGPRGRREWRARDRVQPRPRDARHRDHPARRRRHAHTLIQVDASLPGGPRAGDDVGDVDARPKETP